MVKKCADDFIRRYHRYVEDRESLRGDLAQEARLRMLQVKSEDPAVLEREGRKAMETFARRERVRRRGEVSTRRLSRRFGLDPGPDPEDFN